MKFTITQVTDDIDGTAGAETHHLTIDGYSVEIDLADANRKKLYDAVRPYLDAGRRVPGSKKRRTR